MNRNLIVLMFLLLGNRGFAQCNGFSQLCDLRYDQVAYLTTHNAFNAGDDGFQLPNQNHGLTEQLNEGVRGLMLDVYDQGGIPTVYHGFAFLGNVSLTDNLTEVKAFLDANPREIVTIIFESYVNAGMMETAFTDVGLIPYLHSQTLIEPWPTLQEMVNAGTRLVVFSDSDDAGPAQGWYHYIWDFAVETHFSNNVPADFSCAFNRGDPSNDLFILNHFVTDAALGVGLPAQSEVVNAFDFFYARTMDCLIEKQKFPNFPTVDFYELGETKRVIDSLNLQPIHLGTKTVDRSPVEVESLGQGRFRLLPHGRPDLTGHVQVFSYTGQMIDQFPVGGGHSFMVDLNERPSGTYVVLLVGPSGNLNQSIKLIR